MASKQSNSSDLILSGSQVSVSSSQRPMSAKQSNKPAARNKVTSNTPSTGTGARSKTRPLSGRSDVSSARSTASKTKPAPSTSNGSLVSDDFLALFENSNHSKPRSKSTKTAWGSTASGPIDGGSHASSGRQSHSVFQPVSARSTSTVASEASHKSLSRLKNKSNTPSKSQARCDNLSPHQHGGNEYLLDSERDSMVKKATKLNSIANNMTVQAFAAPKTPLLSMENSYQNIKPKTPINQVRQSPQVGRNIAEDYVKHCNMAATKIQRWFCRHSKSVARRKTAEAAMKRLLDSKLHDKEQELKEEKVRERHLSEEARRSKEERARSARQDAIQELQKKREEKRKEQKRKTDESLLFLQENGKLSKTPSRKSNNEVKSRSRASSTVENISHKTDTEERGVGPQLESETNQREVESGSEGASDTLVLSTKSVNNAAADRASSPWGSQATRKTTLDDLMTTLKKLEEDDKLPSSRKDKPDKNENPLSWLDDLEKSSQASEKPPEDEMLGARGDVAASGLLSDDKLRSIMHYLQEVETAERLSQMDQELERTNDVLERPALLVPSSEELARLEQDTATVSDITQQMLMQKMELEERKRATTMLQKALNQQRELTVRHAKETEREMGKRLDVQKEEYEETIKRHLGFIDQLIDDKKQLSEKCEDLVHQLKEVDRRSHDQIRALQDKHTVEVTKLKEVHSAAEKLRREKWIDEKTRKIKEMTVKGLEPEIQSLIAKHKAEIKKMKSIHEAELLASDERAGQRYVSMTEQLRDQLAHEKETACARERELARQTYEKQLEQEEEAYQQQRRRLYGEVQEEKDRMAQQGARQRMELDRLQRQLEDTHTKTSATLRVEYEKARHEQENRHQLEVKQLTEQLAAEKSSWEENYMKKQETWALAKERELREQVRRDRDKEIELVIERLEEDSRAAREECERVADNRIKRIRDKYEGEISELERTERQTMEKYNQIKAKYAEIEGENERMKVLMKQKNMEVAEVKKLLDKMNEERSRVSDVIRQEFADRLIATEEESRRVKHEMSDLRAKHRVEVERAQSQVEEAQRAKEEEMEEVHKRVKQAILKKEEVVSQMKQQYQAAVKRADHLEGLLEQQRKQLLATK